MPARARSIVMSISVAIAVLGGALAASATPRTTVGAAQEKLGAALRRYDDARDRLSAIETTLQARTAELDSLVVEQDELQTRLSERAVEMYKTGPLGFIDVLVGSATFDEFLRTWDAFTRLERADAATVAAIESAKTRVTRAVAALVSDQEAASRELRALEAAVSEARRELADSVSAWAEYKKQIAARERDVASAGRAAGRDASSPAASVSSDSTVPWKTALCSHYGSGSYGIHLSSGWTIGPDSMIVAHKTLPFGTLVEFSYGGRTAVATVADRGPYTGGREFDLGPGTARVLGFSGVDRVRYRVIGRAAKR